jgi:anti-sigma B factor antagonist/stage II sporulation protein AA (anti-sigma F factor antagonist)
MALGIEVAELGHGGRRVWLRGRLDTETTPTLDQRLGPLLGTPAVTALLLDLGELEYIGSAGIRFLVQARKTLEARGGALMVAHLQPTVRRVIEIVKALPSTDVFEDDAAMDAYIETMQRRASRGPER